MNQQGSDTPRQAQETEAGRSPLKQPETETGHANQATVATAAGRQDAADAGPRGGNDQPKNAPPRQAEHASDTAGSAAHSVEDTHAIGLDARNDGSLDDTVDTDGKNQEAQSDGRRPDSSNAIVSNATLANAVPTPATGLAGIDSRPSGNMPLIAPAPGASVVDEGWIESVELYGAAGAPGRTREPSVAPGGHDDSSEAVPERTRMPANHTRTAHVVKIVPADDGH